MTKAGVIEGKQRKSVKLRFFLMQGGMAGMGWVPLGSNFKETFMIEKSEKNARI